MAHMAVYLRSRPRLFLRASSPVHSSSYISHFSSSSSSSSDPSDETPQNTENTQTSSRNFFSDVLSHLNVTDRQQSQQPPRPGFGFSQGARSAQPAAAEYDEIMKNLSGYTRRSADSSGTSSFQGSQGHPPISFQSLYKKRAENSSQTRELAGKDTSGKLGLESIRKRLPGNTPATDGSQRQGPLSMSPLNLNRTEESNAAGIGSIQGSLPHSVFGNELSEKAKKVVEPNELIKDYTKDELGEKLRNLRPEGVKQGQNWFSLSELNERLIKLRELEQENSASRQNASFRDFRKTITGFLPSESEGKMYNPNVGLFSHRGATKDYMLLPPKENLVEQYYHPDNMSSAEKLELKLKAVRDEFKMSETDCGSTRVQIAQLTTEILHLSKVLHKKDKHSLKGLLAKVQLRKKLLKYLRRTDWDSYCFILSKLGLRDNPGYKQH